MKRLRPDKLHVRLAPGTADYGPVVPRRYTLTHSDSTGELFLTIGPDYDREQVSGWTARFLRDEVLAEWQDEAGGSSLHVYCHVSGGLVLGPAGWRLEIFRRELPLVLEAFRYGDRGLFEAHSILDEAPVMVHFHGARPRHQLVEAWGTPSQYL